MSGQQSKKATMARDTIIYMLAKGIEGIVGIVTMSVMTYLFVTDEMGRYSVINIAVTTVGMMCIQWLVQAVLRYVNKYDIQGKQEEFYATVFSSWFVVNVIVSALALVVLLVVSLGLKDIPAVAKFLEGFPLSVFALGVMWFVVYNTAQLMISMLAALRQAKINLLLSMITVCGKLILMYGLCKTFGSRLEWIFLSYLITDGIVAIIGVAKLKVYKYISYKRASATIFKELFAYGMPLMGNMITTTVLSRSGSFVIIAIIGASSTGIYQTNYSLIATAFTLLSASVMRGSYPTILRTWAEGEKKLTETLVGEAVRMYLLLAIPAVVGVGAVADVMARVLFEAEYFEGNVIMFWVALGMMFLGLTEYAIKPWELNARTKDIFYRSLWGGLINITLNIIFISIFENYFVAAINCFIGYFAYFIFAKMGTRKLMQWHLKPAVYVRIILSALAMGVAICITKNILPNGKLTLLALIVEGIVVYALALFASGEIKQEVKMIANKFNRV